MGQLTMIPICGSSEIEQLCGLGCGIKKSSFRLRLSAFVQKDGLIKMPRWTIVQREPVSPCIAMAEGGLAMAQICQKTG